MGEVYRADDLTLGQEVALKFLPARLAADPERLARLRREVRVARQVSHPNVCRVYDVGEADGQLFLTMEYIDGEDLAALLRRIGRLPEDKGVELARQLCLALAAAHERGVLHRDLKPHNVMIDGRGQVRLTDFGLAGFHDSFEGADLRAGTPAYMAPEQRAGREVSVQSDLYALGLVLYELFTGKRASRATGSGEGTPAPPSSHVSGLNAVVEQVILRCLEQEPGKRPKSALAVAAALPGGDPLAAALAAGETPSPEMVANAPVEGPLTPWLAALLFGLALAGVVLCACLANQSHLYRRVPLERSPEVLQADARRILAKLGCNEPVVGSSWRLFYDENYLVYVSRQDTSPTRWDALPTGRPAALYFWYGQSPYPLDPTRVNYNLSVSSGLPRPDNPPPLHAGMVSVFLDLHGRLLGLRRVPPHRDPDAEPAPEPDWDLLFTEAGFARTDFEEATPEWTPPVYADRRRAWRVKEGRTEVPWRLEAASCRGRAVFFQVIGAWSRLEFDLANEFTTQEAYLVLAEMVLLPCAILGGGFLAWRNWRLGRANVRGAWRLALFLFGCAMLEWAIRVEHSARWSIEMSLLVAGLGKAFQKAASVWVAFLGVEPFVRRRWPWRITSWNRVLEGRLRDPLVGRDVLVGGLCGVVIAALTQVQAALPGWVGATPAAGFLTSLEVLWVPLEFLIWSAGQRVWDALA
jgi:serine/threonine-protein kinase